MPHRAASQDVGGSYEALVSRHDVVGTLFGPSIELTSERVGIFALRMSYRRATGSHLRSGSTCEGFILPGTVCDVEFIQSWSSLSEGGLTADLRAFHGQHVDASVLLTIYRSRAAVRSRGLATGRPFDVRDRDAWSPGIGTNISWYPLPRLPLGIRGTMEAARYPGEEERIVIDAGPPAISDGFTTVRFGAGIVWAFGGRR